MSRSLVVRRAIALGAFAALSFVATASAQERTAEAPATPAPAAPPAHLGLGDEIPWRSDGQEFFDNQRNRVRAGVDRMALVQEACAAAKAKGTLVLWYVHRIQEKTLAGNQRTARRCSTSTRARCCGRIPISPNWRATRSCRCAARSTRSSATTSA